MEHPWLDGETRELFRQKVGLAEMLKGGVIMDVTNADQAKIAEQAGAVAVMALERVPADIRVQGGVARMASLEKIHEIETLKKLKTESKKVSAHVEHLEDTAKKLAEYLDGRKSVTLGKD